VRRDRPPPERKAAARLPVALVAAAGLIAAVLAGCSGNGVDTGNPTGGDTSSGGGCSTVAQGWVDDLDMPSGTYVYVEAGTASNGHSAWVVREDDGAVWATDVDPSTTPSSGGLIVPLNAQARQDSDTGVDLPASAIANLFPDASEAAVSGC